MNKIKLYYYLLILSINACHKGGDKHYYINNAEVKKSVSFKEGSYFIYKDSISGITDSIWIYQSLNYMYDINHSGHTGYVLMVEKCEYQLRNTDSILGRVETIACNYGCENYSIYAYPGCDVHTLAQNCIVYGTAVPLNQKIDATSGYTIYQQYYDSLILNSKPYYKVHQFINKGVWKLHPDQSDSTALTTFYSLEKGLLKYSVKTKSSYQVWEILRNNIIQ